MPNLNIDPVPKRKRARAKALSADRVARGRRFKEARLALRPPMEQDDVAHAIGTNQTSVWRWEERGVVPGGDVLAKAAALYRKSAGYLVNGTADSSPDPGPEPEALREFLAGDWPETKLLKGWMIDLMRQSRLPGEPSVETYRRFVMAYMTVKTDDNGEPGGSSPPTP